VTDKIAIIGSGNIANAIITPLLDKKLIQPEITHEKALNLVLPQAGSGAVFLPKLY
jgi:pyrroline-5-carboxylate reductase